MESFVKKERHPSQTDRGMRCTVTGWKLALLTDDRDSVGYRIPETQWVTG